MLLRRPPPVPRSYVPTLVRAYTLPRAAIPSHSTIAGIRPFAELARGPAAVVYKGYDPERGVVLLKVLTAEAAEDPTLVAWLEEEAASVAAVVHPNVVALYASGRDAGRPYLIMEFVEGLSLDAALAAHGSLPPELAAYVASETARGLGAAHAAGVLHRDLKPANVLLGYDGEVKLTDFGLATRIDAPGAAEVRGTPGYLAPETVCGEPAGPAADLFALGATLAEMLTGRPAFPAASASAALDAALHHDPLPPLRADPRLPPGLVDVAQQLLARDCAARPAEADAVATSLAVYRTIPGTDHRASADALAGFLADPDAYRAARPATPSLLVPGIVPAQPPAAAPAPAEPERPPASAPRPSRRRWARLAGGVLAFAVTAALVVAAVRSVTEEPVGSNEAATLIEADPSGSDSLAVEAVEGGPSDSLVAMAEAPEDELPEDEEPEDEEPEDEAEPDVDAEAVPPPPEEEVSASPGSTRTSSEAAPPETGTLVVVVQPWAEVSVDGRVVEGGEAGVAEAEGLAAGPHRVVLRHPDFPEYTTTVTVRGGESVRLPVSLWSLVERVTLRVHPYAEVYVDGRPFGTVPPQRRPLLLTPGGHALRLVHPSLGTWTAQVEAVAGRERTLSYNLLQLLGSEDAP